MLFSETYFPLRILPDFFGILVPIVFPLYHGVQIMRQFQMTGSFAIWHLIFILSAGLLLTIFAIKFMEKRLIR